MKRVKFCCMTMLVLVLFAACGQEDPADWQDVAYPEIRILFAPSAPHQNITKVTVTVFTGYGGESITKELDIDGRKATGTVVVPIDREVEIIAEAYEGDQVVYRGSEYVYVPGGGEMRTLDIRLGPTTPSEYVGLPEMRGGEWAEYISPGLAESDVDYRARFEYIGMDTIDGRESLVVELENIVEEEKETINQLWIDKESGELTLYVIKVSGTVMKVDLSETTGKSTEIDVAEGASGETPDVYMPGKQTSARTYVTLTGKKVEAAVFIMGPDEVWLSSDVPFGLVKIIQDGELTLELYDFSLSGAIRDISKREAENAEPYTGEP